jgi:protein-disulfide isomerase
MGEVRRIVARRFLFVIVAASFGLISFGKCASLAESSGPEKPASADATFERAIHDYILAHPEVLIESLRRAKQKQQDQIAADAKATIRALRKDLLEDPNSPVLGNPNGDVTIVEFFDYRCPYCRQIEPWIRALLKDDPGVRLVLKEFPILGPASVYAARLALAARKQGRHAEFHDAVIARKPNFDEAAVLEIAKQAGLDVDRLKSDLGSRDVDLEIQRNAELAKALHLSGTPALVVGSELIPGATDLETLKSVVDDARHSAED